VSDNVEKRFETDIYYYYKTHRPALEPTQRLGQRVPGNKTDRPRMRGALLQYVPLWLSYVKSYANTSNTYIDFIMWDTYGGTW